MSSNSVGFSHPLADEWISQAEAARIRGVSRQAIAHLVKRKRLKTLEIAGRSLVLRRDIENFTVQQSGGIQGFQWVTAPEGMRSRPPQWK